MAAPVLADARDADGLTPLHLAVVHGNVPLVQTLLAAGADVNARDDEHHTVVHWATGKYFKVEVKLLKSSFILLNSL